MNRQDLHDRMEAMTPDVPDIFAKAMRDTLDGIVARERIERAREEAGAPAGARRSRRVLAIVLLLALLLGTVAYAAMRWHIFDALSFMTGEAPVNADQVMQGDLAHTTVNGVEITVREAGYDGRTLFIQYTYRMPDVDTPLGMYRTGETGEGIGEDDMLLLYERGVGWWIDQLWIDGQCVDMPGNSGASISGSPTPGEIVQNEYWRLDNVGVELSGTVEIALPIGERQPLDNYQRQKHPEMYDENGNLKKPEKGLVCFTLDTADMLSRVRVEHPNIPVRGENVTARVSEVCFTPLMTYITLALEGDESAIAKYIEENGEGFYSEDGKTLLWPYGGMDVFGGWVSSLSLVDGAGTPLFPDTYGCNGYGNEWSEYLYPYIEHMPEELFLAPMVDGRANMAQAIRVK